MSSSSNVSPLALSLHEAELYNHQKVIEEYGPDISRTMLCQLHQLRPNLDTLKQQPYMSFGTRYRMLDFAFRMLIRLKLLPYVYHRAIRMFDRYCSKRVVLEDQIRLIITTCLWIAAKVHGGNNHFLTVPDPEKQSRVGAPIKYVSHQGRYRLPRLVELVNLCGAKAQYDAGMFKQMEVHILNTLQWLVSDPGVDDFVSVSTESFSPTVTIPPPTMEMHRTKEFLSNVSLTSRHLIDVSNSELAQVILDLANEVFGLLPGHSNYQEYTHGHLLAQYDMNRYIEIKRHLIDAVLDSVELAVFLLCSAGPRYLYQQVESVYRNPCRAQSTIVSVQPLAGSSPYSIAHPVPGSPIPHMMMARLARAFGHVTLQTVTPTVGRDRDTSAPSSALSHGGGEDYDLFEFSAMRKDLPASERASPFDTKTRH